MDDSETWKGKGMNHLINEKSPYLLQHAENPVDWYPWCQEAFERASKEDKPVFLSIGYSTCHWCHVMAHESFEDKEVASVLNRDYICIKVDREERPDIDAIYMAVCQAINGSGGWPLTILMTPDQKPFFAGTYLPKKQRYGYAGLLEVLEKITLLWKNHRQDILDTGTKITQFLNRPEETASEEPKKALLKTAVYLFSKQFDSKWGGFGKAPKFPVPHNLMFLMRYALLEGNSGAMKMAEDTLKAMAYGGIHDHIGGGFSRYSTDEQWLVPHFEKMLYDNALLSMAYLEAFQITGDPLWAHVAKRTLNYVLRELTGPQGEFFCGQDADSDGVEGKYYVFTPEEVQKVLGQKDGMEFCNFYGITEKGNFEGKSIPNRIGALIRSDKISEDALWPEEDLRLKRLYEYRLERTRLHKDDKVILSWNGWMILAFAKAARVLKVPAYLEAAVRADHFIKENMKAANGRLFHRWREGDAAHEGQLDDYAVYGLAQLALYQAAYKPLYLKEAMDCACQIMEFFEDKKAGGYFLTASHGEALIARPKEAYDGAIPSGNSAAAMLLQSLANYTEDVRFREAAHRQLCFLTGVMENYPVGYSMALIAMTGFLYPSQTLICTYSQEDLPEELELFLEKQAIPNLSVILKTKENQQGLAEVLPFTKEYPIPSRGAVYYLCKEGACLSPETDFNNLKGYILTSDHGYRTEFTKCLKNI